MDHSSKFDNQWSPKLAVNYRADDKTKIYGSCGRAYRAPNIAELYSDDSWIWDYGADDRNVWFGGESRFGFGLIAEKGHTETIGFEHNFDENTNIGVNLFNSKIDNGISWVYYRIRVNGEYKIGQIARNYEQEKRSGVELTFNQKINDKFSYNIGYSHTHVDNNYYADVYPQPNSYHIGLHYNNKKFKANLLGIMASELFTDEESDISFASKNYSILDFNTSYDVNNQTTIYFRATNFTNQNYSVVSKDSHSPGRFIQAGINYRF